MMHIVLITILGAFLAPAGAAPLSSDNSGTVVETSDDAIKIGSSQLEIDGMRRWDEQHGRLASSRAKRSTSELYEVIEIFDNFADAQAFCAAIQATESGTCVRTYSASFFGAKVQATLLDLANYADAHPGVAKAASTVTAAAPSYVQTNEVQSRSVPPLPWGLDRIDLAGDDSKYSYPYSRGEGVSIFVLDTGVECSHAEFGAGRCLSQTSFYNDDVDHDGHGTHCAGTAAGTNVGVAKLAKVRSIKICEACTELVGTTRQCPSDWKGTAICQFSEDGIDEVMAFKQRYEMDYPYLTEKMIISFSVSATNTAVERAQMQALADAGIVFVHAAGNSGQVANSAHALAEDSITVGAVDEDGKRSVWNSIQSSNHGANVDIWAPGTNINSAKPGSPKGNTYQKLGGTSMACPHVAGAAALLLGESEGAMTPKQVKGALLGFASEGQLSGLLAGSPNKLLRIDDKAIIGEYQNYRNPQPNLWHSVTVTNPSHDGKTFIWTNAAGAKWTLTAAISSVEGRISMLNVDPDCPYYKSGYHTAEVIYDEKGWVTAIEGPHALYSAVGSCIENDKTCAFSKGTAQTQCAAQCCSNTYAAVKSNTGRTTYSCVATWSTGVNSDPING